uniref:ORF 14 n=1 Tax=Human herpesvirus 3 TaxID=10335 RepID=A0A097HWP9_HHV3|nr:ORF 14 [Human alphaherpesvirus 3]
MKRIQINLILTIACIQLSAESQPTPVSITELYIPRPLPESPIPPSRPPRPLPESPIPPSRPPRPLPESPIPQPTPNIHNHLFYMKIYNAFTAEYNPYPIFTHLSCLVTCV